MPRRPPEKPARWIAHTGAPEEGGKTVEAILVESMRISRRMIQRLTRAKGILLNRRPAFLARVSSSSTVERLKKTIFMPKPKWARRAVAWAPSCACW
mgnify:CR=1 FL=1